MGRLTWFAIVICDPPGFGERETCHSTGIITVNDNHDDDDDGRDDKHTKK